MRQARYVHVRASKRELQVERKLQQIEAEIQAASGSSSSSGGSLAAVATSGAYSDLTGRPTLGTAAAQNTTAFEAAGAVVAHEAASDPHPGYLTPAEGDAAYAALAHGHSSATTSAAGYMSAADKTKLDSLSTDPWTWLKLASASVVSTTAYANVSGMSFTAQANTAYLVEVVGAYQTAATTTGIGLTLDIPSGSIIGINVVSTSATALGGTEVIADAASTGATTGVRAANTNTPITARFVVAIGGTGGTVQLMQRSEIAASNTTLQAGLTIMGYRAV